MRKSYFIASIASLGFLIGAITEAAAQSVACSIGSAVQVEMIDNATGTITEIGTEPPHVGWYRVVYDWNVRSGNPKGEWYNPKNRQIRVAGTNTICGGADTRPGQQQPTTKGNTSIGKATECPMEEPPGKVSKTAAASAALFKRVIYERMAAKVGGASISAPKKVGLTFLEFQMGKAYKNTLSSSRFGDPRRHDGAPVGAAIHPIKTKYVKCELYDRSITRWLIQQDFACFKDRSGDWVCPTDSVPKFLEQQSIPVK